MASLPNRFDLWVRQARKSGDSSRQADLIIGALLAQTDVYFLNGGSKLNPIITQTENAGTKMVLLFSDADRVQSLAENHPALVRTDQGGMPLIVSPSHSALSWCVSQAAGLLVNPEGNDAVEIPLVVLADFLRAWQAQGGRQASGFWIPNLTSAEEDFWQEHGL